MTIVEEIREIRERNSLETIGMSVDELNAYFAKGAGELQKRIDAIRAEKEQKQAATITQ